jgi:hypothetical protein
VRTEDLFRQANKHIRVLSLTEFRAVRAGPARFLNKAGHESADPAVASVVGRHDDCVVVEVGAHDAR